MLAANLKSLIRYDLFKLTKNVGYNAFRSGLLEKTQLRNISQRCFVTKLQNIANGKPVILTVRTNNFRRNVVTKRPLRPTGSPVRWRTVLIVLVVGSLFLAFFAYMKNEKLKKREAYRTKSLGKAKLGGKFDLVNQDNKPTSSDDLLGDWLLLYFGFTHCPDICPDEIEKMVEVVDMIDKRTDMKKVKPVFITVDPERDTPGIIKKYLKEFSDKIIGLTGTVEQIGKTCKTFRVYFSPGPKDSDSDYIVDHSIIMYLIDPEGNFIDYYGQNKNANEIVTSIHFNQMKQASVKSGFQKLVDFFKID